MTTTLTVSAGVILKAGNNASALTEAQYEILINEAESQLCADTRYDWVTNWATLSGAAIGGIAKGAVEDLAAIGVICYDPNVWSLATAQTKVDILHTKYKDATKILEDNDKLTKVLRMAGL